VTTTINMTGINLNPGVSGYPNLDYGIAGAGDCALGQAPQFPAPISSLSQFIVDATYALTGNITGSNNDVLLDEWMQPTASNPDPNQLEVAIFWYYNFQNVLSATYIKQFVVPAVVNGTLQNVIWQEYYSAPPGGGGALGTVWFIPAPTSTLTAGTAYGLANGEVRVDVSTFLKEAQATCGTYCSSLSTTMYSEGNQIGNEFGDTTSPNVTMTLTGLQLQTCTVASVVSGASAILGGWSGSQGVLVQGAQIPY
jgi:hypothetical protein